MKKHEFDYSKAKIVEIEVDGQKYQGKFFREKGIITVTSEYGTTSTQLGGSTEEGLARILLRELVSKKINL